MWAKVDQVFFGPGLDMAYKKMNGIANQLINATFSSNSFTDKIENFIKNQLKSLAKFVPIKKLLEFKNKVMTLKKDFEAGAKAIIDGSAKVGKEGGARTVLPLIMGLAKRLLDLPVLKAADKQVKELAGSLQSVSEGALAILQRIPSLEDISNVMDSTTASLKDEEFVKTQVVALVKSDDAAASAPIDPTELYISILSQLQPYLERMHKYVFESIRSSSFATSIMQHGEAGLDLAVQFCKYSTPIATFHTEFDKLYNFVFSKTVLSDAQYYISYFTGNGIFEFLNKFDDKITDGCEMVAGITEKYDNITSSIREIGNFVQTASEFGQSMTTQVLQMPMFQTLPLDQVVSDTKTPNFELNDLKEEKLKELKVASLDGRAVANLGFADLSSATKATVPLNNIKPGLLAPRTLKSTLSVTGIKKVKLNDMPDRVKGNLKAGDLTDATLKARNMGALAPSTILKPEVLATLGIDSLKDETSAKLRFTELSEKALASLKLEDIVPDVLSNKKLSGSMSDTALSTLSLDAIVPNVLQTLDISNLKGSILKSIQSSGLRNEAQQIVNKITSEGGNQIQQVAPLINVRKCLPSVLSNI